MVFVTLKYFSNVSLGLGKYHENWCLMSVFCQISYIRGETATKECKKSLQQDIFSNTEQHLSLLGSESMILLSCLSKNNCCCCSVTKSCPTLCDTCLPSSPVHVISEARILEWIAISFSRGYS